MRSQEFSSVSAASAMTLLAVSLLLASSADTSVLAFVSPVGKPTNAQSSPTSLFSERAPTDSSSYSAFSDDEEARSSSSRGRRSSEFHSLEPIEKSDERRMRMQQDEQTKARFATFGDELWELRSKLAELSADLISSMASGDRDQEQNVRHKLRDAERRE
jgi:cation diffusion facilitator CzcD-associated flavoprotein CzcO